ncbi:hypothetical protein BH24PSE2_BH24PSE2_12730 [soil metagenome]
MQGVTAGSLLIDGHVHLYDCFEMVAALEAAAHNFAAAGAAWNGSRVGVLMLTETSRDNRFDRLRSADGAGDWRLSGFDEDPTALRARRVRDGDELLIVAGFQVISSEGLEVLTLATSARLADGKPAREIIEEAHAADALLVLPWAVGKWLGRRGRVLDELMHESFAAELFLGDNSGRPWFWRNPSHLRAARRRGMRILPGTDPLPLPHEVERIGSFGCALDASLGDQHPTDDIKRALRDRSIPWRPFGRLETSGRFVRNQIGLRTGARTSPAAGAS